MHFENFINLDLNWFIGIFPLIGYDCEHIFLERLFRFRTNLYPWDMGALTRECENYALGFGSMMTQLEQV